MNKEEILKKAQNENMDEREIQVRDKSLKWTYLTMVVVAAIFAELRAEKGLPMMDLCATVCASVCVGQLYRFVKTKDRTCLLFGVITFGMGIFALIRFCMGH